MGAMVVAPIGKSCDGSFGNEDRQKAARGFMRIGLTVDPLAPALTGIGRYTWELCQGLVHRPEISDLGFFRFDQWVSDPAAYLLSSRKKRRFPWPRRMRRWQMQHGFKGRLVHGTNYFLPPSAEQGIITVHDMSVFRYPDTHPIERVAVFEREFHRSLVQASHVITDSWATRDELLALTDISPDKASVVYLGVSPLFRPMALSETASVREDLFGSVETRYILCVATFEPRKRIEQAIRAHELYCDHHGNDVPLVLIGAKGWRNEMLHDLIDRGTARGRLIVPGYVPEADLPILYAGASLFLYPSIYEGFGLPPVEAMAAGVPVIASDRSCLPEVTQGAAMLVDPDDTDALADAIHCGLHDVPWRKSAVLRGMAVAGRYRWERCIEETVAIYRDVAGK